MKVGVWRYVDWKEFEDCEGPGCCCAWREEGSVRKRVVWKSRGPEAARVMGREARTMERVDVVVLKWDGRLERGV